MRENINVTVQEIAISCTEDKLFRAEIISEFHSLLKILSGEMKIVLSDRSYSFEAGDILLVPRNQLCAVFKRPKDSALFESILITLRPDRLKSYYSSRLKENLIKEKPEIKIFSSNELLEGYFTSIPSYLSSTSVLSEELRTIKIEECISILRLSDKSIDNVLSDFSEPGKIDLKGFMEKNFMFNMSLQKFSYLTGRSISTFNRDFRKIYNQAPQKWLIDKRLRLAHWKIADLKIKPTQVYLEIGFENLSHFSYAFKKHFGYSPSQLAVM